MKSIIRWAIKNTPAMNMLMISVLLVGVISLFTLRREMFPEFALDYIFVTVPYPGATPEEVEEGICQKIEEAVHSISGIKEVVSSAREGVGMVIIELKSGVADPQRVLNEVRSNVDRIPSFPLMAEDPEVEQFLLRRPAIRVGVVGPESDSPEAEVKLREVAEKVRDELLLLPAISQVDLVGVKDYQIDIEISEDTLRKYGLTLQQVAQIVRRENIELPGGSMKTDSQEILLRGKNKRLIGAEIAKIPLVTQSDGVVLTVGDLGTVRDEFVDTTAIHRINGKPGMVISVQKTSNEDLLEIVDQVKQFLAHTNQHGGFQLPPGYSTVVWEDMSILINDRISLLARNGLQGFVLVLVVLTVFLELRLASWVSLGIPISIFGGCLVMLAGGQTLNMMSLFAFLVVLGILVDDAIVVGENVYAHRQLGKKFAEAAVDGTVEVLPSVIASVSTTVIAFVPLLFVPGVMGKFIAILPTVVIAMLVISLLECTFILPCHLAHGDPSEKHSRESRLARLRRRTERLRFLVPWSLITLAVWGGATYILWHRSTERRMLVSVSAALFVVAMLPHLLYLARQVWNLLGWLHNQIFDRINALSNRFLDLLINRFYLPTLRWSLGNSAIVLSSAVTLLLLSVGLYKMGCIPFNAFPKLDGNTISATITFPDGTPDSVTEDATHRIENAILAVDKKLSKPGTSLLKVIHRSVGQPSTIGNRNPLEASGGSHVGSVGVELIETELRDVRSIEIVNAWREASGDFPGAESLSFDTAAMGPGGAKIEFRLLGRPRDMAQLEEAVEKCKAKLKTYPAVFDISDDSQPGKWEFQVAVKERAKALGLTAADLAETVRAAYYGEEVMRLQRGRHEVKLMVRYPRDERRSLANFDDIRVRMQPSMASILGAIAARGDSTGSRQTARAAERPLTELADVTIQRGYSSINRMNQLRSITVTADLDEKLDNPSCVADMKANFFPRLMAEYPDLRLNWEGQQKNTVESIQGLAIGLVLALVAMFILLTFEFRSYMQPLLILAIVPFGVIGAIVGHLAMGLAITLFSLFGLVALTGVVVNDAIVLIDFINHRVRAGIPLKEALLQSGQRRFRPVLLTSLTTVAGLSPILLERSLQAQLVIPMATSLCFGLIFATVLILVLVPTMYLVYVRLTTGDEANLVDSHGLIGTDSAGFIGLDDAVASSESETIAAEEPSPNETGLLEPAETVSLGIHDQRANRDDDGEGEDDSEVPPPRQQTWPPPSHLRRSGGQD
ncbi:MAG: efflux RND transporter permease subunit [Pirellulales bacterium]|nr:efflux RND transporter permease subunit [Pirellulales bacterium]